MALADLESDLASIERKPATFRAWAEHADPDELALVRSYMADNEVPIDPLVAKLRANGIPCTRETVKGYRQ